MTYAEMKNAVVKAIAEKDGQELKHLSGLDGRWYDDIMEELAQEKKGGNS